MSIFNPQLLLLALAIVWPLGQILELPSFHPQAHLYALDVLVLLLFLSLCNKKAITKIKTDPLTKPFVTFTVLAAISLTLALFHLDRLEILIAAAYLIRWITYSSIYFAIRLHAKPAQTQKTLIYSLSAFTLIGLAQYFFFPDVRSLFFYGFDDHFFRLVGTLLDPNFAGLVLVIFTLLLLFSKAPKAFLLLPLSALALTFSRASFLSLIIAVIYLALRQPKRTHLYLFAIIIIALILAPKPYGEGVNLLRTFSISSRIEDSRYGLSLFLEKPIFGQGFNTLKSIKSADPYIIARSQGGLSNSFVFVLATTGIVGFIAYLNFLKAIYQQIKPSPALTASFVAILTHSFFNHSLFYIWILTLLYVLITLPKANKTP